MSNFIVDQFRAPYSFPNNNFICNYVMTKVADQDAENGRWRFKENGVVCKEGVLYNLDYSKTADQKPYFPLVSNYDYCTDCQNSYPHRIHWSLTDNLESDRDNYRVFLANNYRNLDGLGDDIQELLVTGDDLFVVTKNYIYSVPVRPSEIKVQNSIAYLGTGEKLSGPVRKLSSPMYAYGGTDQRVAILSTEFGIIYPDVKTKKIYSLSQQGLQEMSTKNMSTFFENNLDLKLNTAFLEDLMIEYPLLNAPYHSMGVGFQAAYDPRFKRVIINKKDYLPLLPLREIDSTNFNINTLTTSVIYYDKNVKKFFVPHAFTLVEIPLTNAAYFKDMSWTVSYNFKVNNWVSFHSYMPKGFFNNHKDLFSVNDSKIWTHNRGNYTTYYKTKYPHYIEFLLNTNPGMYKMLESLILDHKVLENQVFVPKTFDKINVYNKEHNTGTLTVLPFTDFIRPQPGQCVSRHISDKFNINLFRNYSTTSPTYRLENTSNTINPVDFTKSQFILDRPTGQWMFVRLTLDSTNNYLSILDGVNNIHYNTIR